jgi:hypothetical protein
MSDWCPATRTYANGSTPRKVYDDLFTNTGYSGPQTDHGAGSEHLATPFASVLNAGAGKTKWCAFMPAATALDLSPVACEWLAQHYAFVIEGDLVAIPAEDGEYECTGCFDTLEHLPEDSIEGALQELRRVTTKRLILTVGTFPSYWRGCSGEPLHLTVHPHEWWEERFGVLGELRRELPRPEKRKSEFFHVVELDGEVESV